MKWNYRCEACNCFLDPGEGMLCSECREKQNNNIKIKVPIMLNCDEVQYAFDMKLLEVDC